MLRLVFTCFLALTAVASAQSDLTFRRVAIMGPSARLDGPLVYDLEGRRLLLFGGQDSSARNDLWAFSLERQEWAELNPSGARPPARFGHTTVFDPSRRRLLVFGGQAAGFFGDVWAYDVAANAWRQLASDNAGPSRRYGHSAIYDSARDRMVISHGFTDAGRFDDTWAFELAMNNWRNLSPSGTRPLRRCLHHAVHDEQGGQMLLYGGCASGNGPCPLDDLWSFDLATNQWTQRAATLRPAARQWYAMAFDSARRRLVLFGGSGSRGSLDDTWEYDPATNAWTQLAPRGDAPAPRSRHEAAFVPDLRSVFFFGGRTDSGLTNELLQLAPPSLAAANAFSGQPGAVAPGEIVSLYGSRLGPPDGVAAVLDPVTGALPTRLGGVSVRFNLSAAPLYFVRSDQLNVQVPYEMAGQTEAIITVNYDGVPTSIRVPVVATHPGLFPRAFNQDGTLNSPDNPAVPGSIVVLFGTGQGVTTPPSLTGRFPGDSFPVPVAPTALRIGGRDAELLFQGQAPGTAGVIQFNARIPDGVSGSAVPVVWTAGSAQSQPEVTIAVR